MIRFNLDGLLASRNSLFVLSQGDVAASKIVVRIGITGGNPDGLFKCIDGFRVTV